MKSVCLLAVLGLLFGCATDKDPGVTYSGDPIRDGEQSMATGPARDRVLWQYQTASSALRRGDYEGARQWLDEALRILEGMPAADKSAKKARGIFSRESEKTFRGEPYERVMAYYYRGLLYWRDGDLSNARACFKSGQFEDSDAEKKEFANDYVLLEYLEGLANAKLGADPSQAYQRATNVCKWAVPPPPNPQANVLLAIEYGPGPAKYSSGRHGEELRFRTAPSLPRTVVVKIDNQRLHVGPYDDLNFQATTRGGRVMDHILANKAVFKTSTDIAGDAAIVSGMVLAHDRGSQEIALGAVAAGVITKIISGSSSAEADTRTWARLPQFLSLATTTLPAGNYSATIEFLDGQKRPLPQLTKQISFNVEDSSRDTVIFVSDQSQTPQKL